ncbi:phasin family protein [Halomonas sp. 18H]|uniref:phasin family protein n=1 Tax=Halomonas almeriensis TaxID=308163 RepID=UPI00223071FB|nr:MULTISPECIES: phasin family protein [Halomonas]MCW4149371.1 phasin family protein [Halomonas sp. 18H]MDN3553683.1 phasin family protein [Halomonas almeriensis]
MQDKMMDSFNQQAREFFTPMRKLNSLMLDNMERVTQYQLEAMKRYSQMGTSTLRDATDISDAEQARDFGTRQVEMMTELSNQMLADVRAMSEMSQRMKSEMEALFGESGQAMADSMEEATQATQQSAKSEGTAKANSQAGRKRGSGNGNSSS